MGRMRVFKSGATRSSDALKPDYEGFLSPLAIERFGRYMTRHQRQADGQLRASDNWQKGIPRTEYLKSMWRHVLTLHREHRGRRRAAVLENALCAIWFNVQGYLHEQVRREKR